MKLKVAGTKVGRVLRFQEFDVRPQSQVLFDESFPWLILGRSVEECSQLREV